MSEDNNSMMLVVVLGIAGVCCSSVAGLGFAWYNNYLCECCSLCRTPAPVDDPVGDPVGDPIVPIVPSPEGPPSPDGDAGDNDKSDNNNDSQDKDSNNSKATLPSEFFYSNGSVRPNNARFYLGNDSKTCIKVLYTVPGSMTSAAQKFTPPMLQCKTPVWFELSGKKGDIQIQLGISSISVSSKGVSLGVRKVGSSYELAPYKIGYKNTGIKNRWDIKPVPGVPSAVYLFNTGYRVYLGFDNCSKGTLKFYTNNNNSNANFTRWRMSKQNNVINCR